MVRTGKLRTAYGVLRRQSCNSVSEENRHDNLAFSRVTSVLETVQVIASGYRVFAYVETADGSFERMLKIVAAT